MTDFPDPNWLGKAIRLCEKHNTRLELPNGLIIEPAQVEERLDVPPANEAQSEEIGATIHDLAQKIRDAS